MPIEKCKQLSMNKEAKIVCMGVLSGIYDFHRESSTEYKDWAVDAPAEFFRTILDDWRRSTKKPKDLAEMDAFIENRCPDWAASSRKRRR